MSDLKPAIMNIEARLAGDGGSAARCHELGGLKLAHGDAEGAIAAYRLPHVNFVSLQKGSGEEQLESVTFGDSILRLRDLDAGPDAFLDTAAILTCVDLLVTSDSAIAHLGGALCVSTWLCLMREPDWRWMLKGADTPWYSSVRLFRQPASGDWASVYGEIANHLALWALRHRGGTPI
jgi:hypothetical protein